MNRVRKMLLIGAGEIGSRHLQAMALTSEKWDITVVDPNIVAIDIANARWLAVAPSHNRIHVKYSENLPLTLINVDVAIIATSARHRLAALSELLHITSPMFLVLEKVLFQSINELEEAAHLLSQHSSKVYVNCPRRIYPHYQKLKLDLQSQTKIDYRLTGSHWDMGCNAIHHIDLWCFLTQSTIFTLSTQKLNLHLISGKRIGTKEITGELIGLSQIRNRKDTLSLQCADDANAARRYITQIITEDYEYLIDEPNREIRTIRHPNREASTESFELIFQSQMTHLIADQLVEEGRCGLTPFEDSYHIHHQFLEPLTQFFCVAQPSFDRCPIT